MPLAIFILLLPLLVVLLYAFAVFDRLLRAEYQLDRGAWDADGRPAGFFWRAPECAFIKSGLARSRIAFTWLFCTPAWVATTPALGRLLQRLRWAVLTWNVGVLVWLVFVWRLRYIVNA